jgi:Fe-Mn family superoxide dismutase
MTYQVKNYDHLIGATGFSEQLLKNHFTLYQGYVSNTNKLQEMLSTMSKENKTSTPEYAEMKRRFGWEWNGMRLHERYFDNIMKDGTSFENDSPLYKLLENKFSSYTGWQNDFKSTGMIRGIGWTILYLDVLTKEVFNLWVNEHDVGHLSGCIPLLVMDVFEHAYILDYGLKRADYIEAFFKNIDWNMVNKRLRI